MAYEGDEHWPCHGPLRYQLEGRSRGSGKMRSFVGWSVRTRTIGRSAVSDEQGGLYPNVGLHTLLGMRWLRFGDLLIPRWGCLAVIRVRTGVSATVGGPSPVHASSLSNRNPSTCCISAASFRWSLACIGLIVHRSYLLLAFVVITAPRCRPCAIMMHDTRTCHAYLRPAIYVAPASHHSLTGLTMDRT